MIVLDHSTPEHYFVGLFWQSLQVGDFVCSLEQYNPEIIPQIVMEATKTYPPPFPPAAEVT